VLQDLIPIVHYTPEVTMLHAQSCPDIPLWAFAAILADITRKDTSTTAWNPSKFVQNFSLPVLLDGVPCGRCVEFSLDALQGFATYIMNALPPTVSKKDVFLNTERIDNISDTVNTLIRLSSDTESLAHGASAFHSYVNKLVINIRKKNTLSDPASAIDENAGTRANISLGIDSIATKSKKYTMDSSESEFTIQQTPREARCSESRTCGTFGDLEDDEQNSGTDWNEAARRALYQVAEKYLATHKNTNQSTFFRRFIGFIIEKTIPDGTRNPAVLLDSVYFSLALDAIGLGYTKFRPAPGTSFPSSPVEFRKAMYNAVAAAYAQVSQKGTHNPQFKDMPSASNGTQLISSDQCKQYARLIRDYVQSEDRLTKT